MERGLLGTSLNGSTLVALLAQLTLLERPAGKPCIVEGMGQWLGWADAINLSAALNAPPDTRPGHAAPPCADSAAAEHEFERVRTALARAIEDDGAAADDSRRAGPQALRSKAPPVADTDFPAYRRRYVELQQAMDAAIAPLRARLRAAVARRSPEMGRLAAVDAVLDDVLGARQQSVLATMPSLLETHFKRLRRAADDARGAAAETAPTTAWLNRFRQDMQRLLLAELDLRLQPVQGLLDVLRTRPQGLHD